MRLHYEDQQVNVVYGNNPCLVSHKLWRQNAEFWTLQQVHIATIVLHRVKQY
jgi:hypothetical protein